MPRERIIGLAVSHVFAYYRDILRAIVSWAEIRPHWSFVFLNPVFDRNTREALKHVDAAVVAIDSRESYEALPPGIVVVDVSDEVRDIPCPRVANDNAVVGQLAAQHFLQRGLRAFGYVGQSHYRFSIERECAMRSTVEAAGHRLAVHDFCASTHDLAPMGYLLCPNTDLADWLLSLPQQTGVLTMCDHWAVEVLQLCRDVGLRVPEDIAVLGVDDDEFYCRMARPALSSVILASEAIGQRAAELIESLLGKRSKRRTLAPEILLPPVGIATRRSTDVLAIDEPDVVTAIRFIRENCHRPIDVSDVLKEVSVSRRWLERRVRDAIGITLGAEIRGVRIERAKRLLLQTKHSIADVAKHSGFTDIRHIEKCFRDELGQTPTQFRRSATGG